MGSYIFEYLGEYLWLVMFFFKTLLERGWLVVFSFDGVVSEMV